MMPWPLPHPVLNLPWLHATCPLLLSWAPNPLPALHPWAPLWSLQSAYLHGVPPSWWGYLPGAPIRQWDIRVLAIWANQTFIQQGRALSRCPSLQPGSTHKTIRPPTQCPDPSTPLRRQQLWATPGTLLNLGLLPDPKSEISTLDFHFHQGHPLINLQSTVDPYQPPCHLSKATLSSQRQMWTSTHRFL